MTPERPASPAKQGSAIGRQPADRAPSNTTQQRLTRDTVTTGQGEATPVDATRADDGSGPSR